MTSKKLLSAVLALMLMMSFMTALPVSADADVTATVSGVAVSKGGQISAVSTVVFNLPEAVADLTAVKFYEQSKSTKVDVSTDAETGDTVTSDAYHPWYERAQNYAPVLSNDNKTLTVTFERGDISANGTYKFEFDTNAESAGAEYTFNFTTKPEVDAQGRTVYFAENYTRYATTGTGREGLGFAEPSDTDPSKAVDNRNLMPVTMVGAYVGRPTDGNLYAGIDTIDGAPALKTYGTTVFSHYGTDPRYSGTINSLTHRGELTVQFQTGTAQDIVDITGIAFVPADLDTTDDVENDGMLWKVYGETVRKSENAAPSSSSKTKFVEENYRLLGSYRFASEEARDAWHTVSVATDTRMVADGKDTREVLAIKVGDTVVWEKTATDSFTLPAPANTYGGFNKGVPWNSTQLNKTLSKTVLFGYIGTLYVRSAEYKDYILPAANVVTAPTNEVVSQTGTISYTFDKAMDAATITNDTVVLEEENKSVADTWIKRDGAAFVSLDAATKKTLTLSFPAGALAPNTKYRVSLKTGLKTAVGGDLAAEPTPYVFTTDAGDGYIINDNFSRYLETNYTTSAEEQANSPYALTVGWSDGKRMGIVTVNGEKALMLSGYNGSKTLTYNTNYSNLIPAAEKSYDTITEFTFTLNVSTGLVDLSGVAIKAVDEDTYEIYARTGNQPLNTRAGLDMANFTLIDTINFASASVASGKHTLKFVTNINFKNSYENRTLYSVYLDDQPVGVTAIGDGIELGTSGNSVILFGLFGNSAHKATYMIHMLGGGTSTGGYSVLHLYSVKQARLLDVEAEAGSTTGSLNITVTNNDEANQTAKVVLAAYDGNTLVGVDGLAENVTLTKGQDTIVTRTVANATAGNTYKVMILNSKEELQPLVKVTEGTID